MNQLQDTVNISSMNTLEECSVYLDVIESPEFNRLKDISFLGILGYFCQNGDYSSRYEHSISVANKCLAYSRKRSFSKLDEQYFVLAGLLHDIGHCGFSHSLEPVFMNKFEISHHDVSKQLIICSSNMLEIWSKYNIDPQRIVDTMEGLSSRRNKLITKMPINFDTLDGIARTERHFSHDTVAADACQKVFNVLCNGDRWTNHINEFDLFWNQKERIYNSYIYSHKYGFIELVFQKLFMDEQHLDISHFLLSDSELRTTFPCVDMLVNDIKSEFTSGFVSQQLNDLRKTGNMVSTSLRNFGINFSKKFSVSKNQRYFETKKNRVSSL